MSERRAGTKGRRLGSSRRRQIREGSSEAPAPGPGEEQPWLSEMVQDFLREQDKDQAGFITRSDIQKFQEEGFPCSTEELELVFDGLDAAGTGRLSTEEFTAGLRQFLSSQKAAREHRRRKTASRRVRLVLPSPALEGVDSEERRHFAAFMDQLGTNNVSEEQEIWQLWVKLRQDEPQLLGNLEDFLAKMRHRIQEAKSKKEALEVTLNERVAEHDKEVQQLCEVLEQQIQQEQQRLEQKSVAQSHQQDVELQRVLDASEREVQRLVTAQMELERRCCSLRSTQQVTSTENRELEASNRMLEDHLQHLHQQLKQTQGHLRTMRATVAWEHVEEPGDRAVAELPSEMPMSPQSPGKSEKFRSEMRIRLGSQSEERKAKNTHQVVWEMLPAEISISGAPPRASSAEEEPFPEYLKEEHFSDQSSLLREMNDAIAALSKHLKAQAPGAPPALADTASHPQDDAEPKAEQEAATAHGTTPGVLQDTLPGHVSHELFEGDLKEGPATAEFRALDVTQAGASVGAGHHMAQEPGAEQGESPEEAQRMIFLQGKGAGVKEMVLKVTEHPGESKEAGEQAVMEVEGAGWRQENTGWEKAQLLGEAEEAGIRQGESLEAGLGPPEAGQAGLAVGQCLALEEVQPGAAPGERVEALALQEWADPSLGLSEKLETELGEHLEPEPPSRGEAQVGAAQGDGVTPEVTAAPAPGVLEEEEEEERVSSELQPQGEPSGAEVLPAPAEHGMSCRAGGEEEEVEETQPREAELQLQGGSVRGDAGRGGSAGAEVPLAAAVPPPDVREGGVGAHVEPLEAQNSDTNTQLLAEGEADPQVGSPGTGQGGSVDPGVRPQLGLGEERGAAEVHSEGPSLAETPAGSSGLCGLFPVRSQAWELVEAEDAQADVRLRGGLSPETLWGAKGGTDVQTEEEEEGGAQGQGECELPQEPVLDPHGAAVGQGEGVGTGVQPQEEDENLDTLEDQSTAGNVQLLMEVDEIPLIPGGSTEADLQLLGEAGSTGTEQGGSTDPGVQPLDQVDVQGFLEMEAEDAQVDVQLRGGLSPGAPWGGEGGTAIQLEEEGGAQGQGECELPQEPVLDPHGAAFEQGEEAGAGVQLWEGAASLDTPENQSTAGNVQLLTEVDKLESTPAESTESDLQPLSKTDSLGSEQGGSVDPGVQPLDQVDTADLVEMVETEDSWSDKQLSGDASPETPQQERHHASMELGDEAEAWGQGQGEHGLPQEPVLDTLEDQSTDANMQLLAEEDELRLTPGGSTEAELQLLGEAGSPGTEQGGRLDPDVQPLDQVDEQELVEMEAEGAQTDTQLGGGLSLGAPWGGEGEKTVQLEQEEEDGGQGQGECGLPLEPVLDVRGTAVRQGEGAGEDMQSQEEAESLDTLEDQSTDATVQSLAEEDEIKLTPGESTEADLQLLGEAGSTGTEQGGSSDPGVQPLDQVDVQGFLEMEAEDAQVDVQLRGGLSPGAPWGGEGGTAIQLEEEGGAQGQGECELPQEPVLDPHGAAFGQGEVVGAGVQLWEGAESLDTPENQSTDGNVQLLTEVDKLESAPGESTESDLQPLSETDSLGTEQGGSVNPGVQPLDQVDKAELVEMETQDSWTDMRLCGGASPETPQGKGDNAAVQLRDEAEDWGQGQGELVLDPQGARARQGEGVGAGAQPREEAESLDTLEGQSTDANMQLSTEEDELKLAPGGSTETGVAPLGAAGMWEGKQSLTPGVGAGLCAAHITDTWQGVAAAHVPPPAEADLYPEPVTAAEGLGLEAKLGAPTGPDGQILGDTQALELPQGEGAAAEGKPLDGAQGLEVVQGERLEAGVRSVVESQGVGRSQGHNDGLSAPASLVPEVPSQTVTVGLETMMQEDVLIPDVWRLCASGQAAQSELQEQVSAQGHQVRIPAPAQQPEGKTPCVVEPEQGAAGPAEPPKQEVPPVSTLHLRVQPQEDAGNDQLGMVLADSSLGDSANIHVQPQRQLLGEQGEDLRVGQREKLQEFGQKMSQEGEPSPGEPEAVTAEGAGAAPEACPKAPLGPDHLYNVLFVGDSHVGKTSFLYRLHADSFNPNLTATVGLDYRIKNLVVDNKRFALRLWDSAGQERYHSMTKQFFRKADGVVLMYDITSQYSFSDVRYWLSCIQEAAEDGVAVLLLGNKTDCAAERRVPVKEGECLAKEHQLMFYECSAASGHNVLESMVSFTRLLKVREDELKKKAEEVPKAPQKKKNCCW